MPFEVTLNELSEIYGISCKSLFTKLDKNGFKSVRKKDKKNVYGSNVIEYLNELYTIKNTVEIIQVPVYINVHWVIYESKINQKDFAE